MSAPEDYYQAEAETTTRARIFGYAKAAGLRVTNFVLGSVPHQFVEIGTSIANKATALAALLVRGHASLDTATDPGDFDPYDATNALQPPARGHLSRKGEGDFGTPRLGDTFATGRMPIVNASGSALYIAPEQVTFTRDTANTATGLAPTYRNAPDPTIYTNPDGTVTIPNGAGVGGVSPVYLPVIAEEQGTASNAGANHVTLTTSLGTGVTATNDTAIAATAREDADAYRARCRTAAAILSPNGPDDAYRYIALAARKNSDTGAIFFIPPWGDGTTGIGIDSDGNRVAIPNATGDSLGVNRVYVDEDGTTGNVGVYFADAGGAPDGGVITDLTALLNAYVRPQCNTVLYYAATEVAVVVDGTVKAKAGAGVTAAVVAAAIGDALTAASVTWDIGGYDQTAGAGTLYSEEIDATVNGSHPKIYKVTLSSPSNTALAKGHVAVVTNSIGAGDVTIV